MVDALYYSTSCGYMQDGTLFGNMDSSIFHTGYIGLQESGQDFDTYLRSGDEHAYEANERYFRWQASLTGDDLSGLRGTFAELPCHGRLYFLRQEDEKEDHRHFFDR